MSLSTSSKCLRLSKSHEPTMETMDIKTSLRDMGRKNYLEQDEDSMSDYGPAPRKKLKRSPPNTSERKLSLRGQQNSTPVKIELTSSIVTESVSPKRKYLKRTVFAQSDRKLRNQTIVESNCCGQAEPNRPSKLIEPSPVSNETKVKRKSRTRRLTTSSNNHDSTIQTSKSNVKLQLSAMSTANGRNLKAKSELSKPKVIGKFLY